MFEDQQTAFAQQPVVQHQPDDFPAAFQIVRGVGEDDVELFRAAFQVEKGIGLDRIDRFASQLPRRLPDEVVVHGVDFDCRDAASAARSEFVADRSRAREEVEYVALFEIDQIGQDVEKVLLGEVRRGTCPQILRRVDRPALVSAADYSHRTSLKYFRNWRASVSLPDRQSG